MKAAIVDGNGHLRLGDVPEPIWDEYDCLVRTEAISFCNSTDRHIIEGKIFNLTYPAILGHESVGKIAQVGAKVRHLHVGDRVLRPYAVYPGHTLGGYTSAWGGFAEWTKVRDWQAMADDGLVDRSNPPFIHRYQQVVPPAIAPEEAVLMIGQKEIYSCVQQIPTRSSGRRFIVTGAGVTAVLFGQFLRKRGDYVAMVARRAEPLEFARRHGSADTTALLSDSAEVPDDFDALIETTGSVNAVAPLLAHVQPGGNMYAYAVYEGMDDDAIYDPFRKHHLFCRIDPAEASAHQAVCELAVKGDLKSKELISYRLPFSDIERGWQLVASKQSLKIIMLIE